MAPRLARLPADLGVRALAGGIMAGLAAIVVYLGGWYFVIVVMIVLVLMAGEWAKLTMGGSRKRYAVVGIVLLPLLLMALLHHAVTTAPDPAVALVGGGLGAVLLLASVWLIRRVGGWTERLWAVVGIVYLGVPALAFLALREQPHGMELVFWLVIVVVATDVFAYLVGRGMGGPKLAPDISPGKTWAGLLGGALGAVLCGTLFASLGDWNWLQGALFALILALVAQSGDLFESFIKRRAGVKDSGQLIPGHGGMLDRLDGYLFAVPTLALLVAIDQAL